MKYCLTFFFLFLYLQISHAQQLPYEYMGAIKLNDSAFISYKLVFTELNGVIKGYSISDIGGPYETKSTVVGTYDEETNDFNFRETDIVYTKSPLDSFDMCLVHFSNKLRKLKSSTGIQGQFKGKYIDNLPCLNGDLIMTSMETAVERAKKVDKKLQKTRRVSQEIKDKFNALAVIDTLSQSTVKKSENLNVFAYGNEVIFSIYDSGKVDDDRINLYINDRLVLDNYTITADKEKFILKRQPEPLVVKIKALSEGTSPPNTVRIEALDKQSLMRTRTLLHTDEEAYLTFYFK